MIPTDRPVVGKDLEAISQAHGLQAADAIWLFGLSPNKWSSFVRGSPDQPLDDPTLALLVRILDQNPELRLIPKFPTPTEMMDLLVNEHDFQKREFSVMFGFEASAGDRWIRLKSRISSTANHLFWCLQTLVNQLPASKRAAFLSEWRETVAKEAQTRGIEDVFLAGSWSKFAANDD